MGKAQILTAKGQGLYRVQVLPDNTRAEAEIAQKTARLAEIASRQTELTAETNEAYLAWNYAKQVLDAKIYAYQQAQTDGETRIAAKRAELAEATEEAQTDDPDTTVDESEITSLEQAELDEIQAQLDALIDEVRNAEQALKQAQQLEREAFVRHQALRAEAARLTLEKAAAQKRIGYLQEQTAPPDPVDAWCADYNETLSGDVGTIEVGRRAASAPILRPGGASGDQAGHDPQRDGQTQAIASATPAAAFWNAALRPGFDRWRPRYRLGEITSLDTAQGIADVVLDAETSTHQALDINLSDVLADVPIQYLDCNADAFEIGDRVVIGFQGNDWDQPRIIGFESEPRACYVPGLLCRTADGLDLHIKWADSQWSASEKTAAGGNIDWRGLDGEIVTWRGAASRYWANQVMGATPGGVYSLIPGMVFFTDTTFPAHYVIERVIQPLPPGQTLGSVGSIEAYAEVAPLYDGRIFSRGKSYDMGGWIMGAARRDDKLLFVRGTPDSQAQNASEQVCIYDLSTEETTVLGSRSWAVEFPSSGQPAVPHNMTPWLINASATEAIAVRTVEVSGVLEAHKFRLFVNWETLSASWQDEGRAQETEIDKTTAISYEGVFGVSGGGYRHYGSQDVSQTDRIWFWDWDGDTEISGEIKVESTIYTYGEQRQDPPVDGGDPFFWEERIYNELEAAQLTITMRGVQVYSGQIGHSDTAKLAQGYPDMEEDESHITHAGSLSGEMTVVYADLRNGMLELETRTSESFGYATERVGLDMFSGLYYAEGFTVDNGGENRWRWQISGPSISEQETGTPWTFTQQAAEPLNPVADQSQYDFDFGPSETGTDVTGQYGYINGRVRCGGTNAIFGRTAGYPGEITRVFVAAPVGLSALVGDWDAAEHGIYVFLTGGNPHVLTSQDQPGDRYTPIVVI